MSTSAYKDCTKCGDPVHRNAKSCKSCGGPTPWAAKSEDETPPPAPPADAPAGSVVNFCEKHQMTFLASCAECGAEESARVDASVGDVGFEVMTGARDPSDALNPTDADVAAFIRQQPSVVAAAAEQALREEAERALNGPHVFLEKYSTQIGSTMAHFKHGQVITDFALVQVLRARILAGENVPMVPTTGAPGMTCCPNCRTTFRVPSVLPAKRAG